MEGKKARCKCGKIVVVKGKVQREEKIKPAKQIEEEFIDKRSGLDRRVENKQINFPERRSDGDRRTKNCPFCGEDILAVARKCKHCGEFLEQPGQAKEVTSVFSPPSGQDYLPSGPQIRPWVRYLSRYIDIILFSLLIGIFVFFDDSRQRMNDTAFGLLILFLYVFVEPCMLSFWGTTPGKALLKVRLRKSNGNKPSYQEALSRSFKVWFRGLGLGIPIIALFTQISAYNELTKIGATSWDQDGDFKVYHQVIGAGRVIAAIVILIAIFFFYILGILANL